LGGGGEKKVFPGGSTESRSPRGENKGTLIFVKREGGNGAGKKSGLCNGKTELDRTFLGKRQRGKGRKKKGVLGDGKGRTAY